MSGGAFDYKQYNIREIHETMQSELERMGQPKHQKELWYDKEYYDKHPEELNWATETDDVENAYKRLLIY